MALNIRLQRNEIKSNANYGKYYARVVNLDEVTIDDFSKEIQGNCSMKERYDSLPYHVNSMRLQVVWELYSMSTTKWILE